MKTIAVTLEGQTVLAQEKHFSTGSDGFNLNAKVLIEGKMYQLSGNIVEIGSKKRNLAGQVAGAAPVAPVEKKSAKPTAK